MRSSRTGCRCGATGATREFVRILGWWDEHGPDANMQITPDGDYTQTGVRFNKVGYGNPHHTQLVTAPAAGGLYYVEAEGESGAFFAAPWVVAPAAGREAAAAAPVAVVMSTNTWNAYNNFGGRSNYVNSTGLPAEPTVYGRQELTRYKPQSAADWASPDEAFLPLSFERPEPFNSVPRGARPEDPIAGRQPNHLAPAEWRLLAWLEREGFAYDVYSDAQLDDGTLDLDAYRVVMISAHPEYWTKRAFERTLAWVEERGGHFMYLGGNGLNAEVELLDGATRMHVKSHLAAVNGSLGQPDPADPSHWFDSRFHRATGPARGPAAGRRDHRDRDHDRGAVPGAARPTTGSSRAPACATATSSARNRSTSACPAVRRATRRTRCRRSRRRARSCWRRA